MIIATCDFDFSFPAIQAAGSANVPGIALCASSPKVATPDIVGPYGGSMGLGSDAEGVAMAEWLVENKPELKRAYVFRDDSLEYSKATADYFKARWLELGGEVCGEDTFVGGPRPRSLFAGHAPSRRGRQLRLRLRRLLAAIRLPAHPGDPRCRHGHLDRHERVGERHARERGRRGRVSNFLALGFACLPTYCEGTQTESVVQIAEEFEAEYGEPLGNHYALPG